MPLTPADVHNVAFSKPPLGKRGYDENEVDAFLDLAEAELARLLEKNSDLRNQVEQLDQQRRAAPVDTGPHLHAVESPGPVITPVPPPMTEQTSPGGDHNVHAAKVLGLAQEMAERLTGEATADADAMLGQARTKSEQLLSDARAKADGMVNDARTRAETMLNDARTKAETLERQSRDKAASLERDAARKHTEILTKLSQEKGILEKKIDELRTFERDYRTRLKTHLDSQLRDLDGRESATPLDPVRNRQDLATSGFGAHAEAGTR
ncbi:MAG: DivIVA domain-containing protein [Actinobacteria bacterium]|nr:DivIVA domain-containing protein [Actinomycetota bacterium]